MGRLPAASRPLLITGGIVLFVVMLSLASVLIFLSDLSFLRGAPSPVSEYVRGIEIRDADLVEAHICRKVWNEVEALPGGFSEAVEESLAAVPGEVDYLARLRGNPETAVVDVETSNGGRYFFHIDAIEINGRRVLCPPGPASLLGTLHREVTPPS